MTSTISQPGVRNILLLVLLAITHTYTQAYDFMAGHIYYNILSRTDHTVSVTYKDPRTDTQYFPSAYKGSVVVPSTVAYKGVRYTVVEIGRKAFCFAKDLTSVTIPNTVRSIRFNAFCMTGLSTLHIPASVVKIEGGFLNASDKMKTITVAANSPYFKAVKNVLFNKAMTRLIYCTPAKRASYTVPSTVKRLEHMAFCCCTITKLTIPSSVNVFVGDPFISLEFEKLVNKTKPSAKHIPTFKGEKIFYMSPGTYLSH